MMVKQGFLRSMALALALVMSFTAVAVADTAELAQQEAELLQTAQASDNPLVNPDAPSVPGALSNLDTANRLNILLLGIDDQQKDYTFRTEMAHTDAMLLLSVNLDTNRTGNLVDLISIPRDTLAYVPGVKGIYKINSAINCGDALAVGASRADAPEVVNESAQGFQTTCDTVSWLLGGVKVDYYCAVTMQAMMELGNAIGGVEYDLEMTFTGDDGKGNVKRYKAGLQTLDGAGIVSYIRARHNATQGSGSDLARADRQRDMMMAILNKFVKNKALILTVMTSAQTNPTIQKGLYTNVDAAATTQLMNLGMSLLASMSGGAEGLMDLFGSYSLGGSYQAAFGNWKFGFIDQDNRIQVLSEVFGAQAEPLRYVSRDYANWLYKTGFQAVRYLYVADDLRRFTAENYQYDSPLVAAATAVAGDARLPLSSEQVAALSAVNMAYGEAMQAFLTAAIAVDAQGKDAPKSNDKAITATCVSLKKAVEAMAKLVGYPGGVNKKAKKIVWKNGTYLDEDPMINAIYVNFR